MLRSIKDLEGYAIRATDGDIGHVKDFYFDDAKWVIRYLVVETGTWLTHRNVLISPIAVGQPNETDRNLPVAISMEQVETSPDIDTQLPVSRQEETDYLSHFGYAQYWAGTGLWGSGMYPRMMMPEFTSTPVVVEPRLDPPSPPEESKQHQGDPHLRGCNEVMGYHIRASDEDIGRVAGMLVDEASWAIRYLIVDTSNWWLGHQVLIAPEWFEDVNWSEQSVSVKLTRKAVKDAPTYDPANVPDSRMESEIWAHYSHVDGLGYDPDRVRISAPR
jgi:hypothetical protein